MSIDFKKTLDSYKAPTGTFRVIQLPAMQYLMLDGSGDPNTSLQFADAITTLYPVAYKLKFASKQLGRDYVVAPLEGLWWSDDYAHFTSARDKSKWSWTLMLMAPDWITGDMFAAAVEAVALKTASASLDRVRLETLDEGRCVQTLHVGSFDSEAEILARLHNEFIPSNGFSMVGKHHEIYLSDARRVTPDKQRTILRQPIADV